MLVMIFIIWMFTNSVDMGCDVSSIEVFQIYACQFCSSYGCILHQLILVVVNCSF